MLSSPTSPTSKSLEIAAFQGFLIAVGVKLVAKIIVIVINIFKCYNNFTGCLGINICSLLKAELKREFRFSILGGYLIDWSYRKAVSSFLELTINHMVSID